MHALKMHVSETLSADLAHIAPPPTSKVAKAQLSEPNDHAEEASTAEEDASSPPADTPASAKDTEARIQRLFDTLYLSHVLSTPQSDSPLESVAAKLHEGAGIDEATQQRLGKSAREYWKRTYLLFGLLAGRGG